MWGFNIYAPMSSNILAQVSSRASRKMQDRNRNEALNAGRSAAQEVHTGDDGLDYLSWLASFNKHVLLSLVGFPYYSPAYVREHIDKPTTGREELQHYKTTAEPARSATLKRYVLFLFAFTYLIKSIVLPFVVLSELDLKNPESNVIMLTNDTYRFGCLVSNCTKLGQLAQEQTDQNTVDKSPIDLDQLSRTLFELPYLLLCHPNLAKLYDPTQHSGPDGIMLVSLISVMLTIVSSFVLLRDIYKADNMMLMFLTAPRVTRQVVRDRAKTLLNELRLSRLNFKLAHAQHGDRAIKREPLGKTGTAFHLRKPTRLMRRRNHTSLSIPAISTVALPELMPIESCGAGPSVLEGKQVLRKQLEILQEMEEEELQMLVPSDTSYDSAAEDCVSIMRSAWWRARALNRALIMTTSLLIFCALVCIISLYLIIDLIPEYQAKLNEIGSSAVNCSIWRLMDSQSDHPLSASQDGDDNYRERYQPSDPNKQLKLDEQVHLDRLQLERSYIRTLVYVSQPLLPFVGYITFVTVFLLTCEEITGWLCEIKFELLLGTEFVKQLVSSSSGQFGASTIPTDDTIDYSSGFELHDSSSLASKCKMAHTRSQEFQHFKMDETIRGKFKFLAGVSFVMNLCKLMGNNCLPASSRLESVQAIEEFVTERIVADRLCLCSAVDLLEKLHTSFRIFVEHVRCCDRTITIMVVCANVFNYFVIFTDLIYIRTIRGHLLFPSMALLVSWYFINLVIVMSSNFHAKASKLHTLIWSLIAITSRCPDIRIKHMRHLWLKQVQALDMDRGLSLKALGLRITYTNIIQLVVASGTIVVFMLR